MPAEWPNSVRPAVRGCKRAIDAIAAGMSQETPAYRALTEAAAFGPDFAEGRAAFAAKRTAKFTFRGTDHAADAPLAGQRLRDPSPGAMIAAMPNDVKPPDDPPAYVDPVGGQTYPISEPRWRSDMGAPLMITALPGIGRDRIDTGKRSLWRYAAALPVDVPDPITMGEGCTPLVSRRWRGAPALFKLEWFSPTGSFKDRGAAVMLSILRGQGVTRVLEDSSGNGGAAISAYAAAGGMSAKILVPASTAQGKTVQMRAYGAEIELIPGTRQDVSDAAIRQAATIFYAGHNWQPFFLQGTKTLAYELWEDLKFNAPDNVIIPTGAGSNILGLRHRLQRASAPWRDWKTAPAVRGAAGELRAASRQLRGGV